jgi:hypothetical protein
MPVFDRFEADLVYFDPQTTHVLLELRGFVRDIENTAELLRRDKGPVDEKANHYMQLKAIAAANLVPRVKKSLEAAGGTAPLDPEVEVYPAGELPSLGKPAFPNAAKLGAGKH